MFALFQVELFFLRYSKILNPQNVFFLIIFIISDFLPFSFITMLRELVVSENKWVTLGYHPSFSIDLTPVISDPKEIEISMFVGHILSCSNTGMIFIEIFNPITCVCINGERIDPHVCIAINPGSILSFVSRNNKFPKFKLILKNQSSLQISPVDRRNSSIIIKGDSGALTLCTIEHCSEFYSADYNENIPVHRKYIDQNVCHPAITLPKDPEHTTVSPLNPDCTIAPRRVLDGSESDECISLRKSATNLYKPCYNMDLGTVFSKFSDTDGESKPKEFYPNMYLTNKSTDIVELSTQTTLPIPVTCRDPNRDQPLNLNQASFRTRTDMDLGSDTLPTDFLISPFVITQSNFKAEEVPLSRLSMSAPKDPQRAERVSEVCYGVISARSVKYVEKEAAVYSPPMSLSWQAALRLMDRVLGIRMKGEKVEPCTELVTPFTDDAIKTGILRDFESVVSHLKHVLQSKSLALKLSSPIFACGDLRGSLSDLRAIYKAVTFLSHWSAMNVPVLFLGDYLACSSTNLEVIFLLFSWSLLCPDVHMLRGSNEFMESKDRVVNGVFFGTMPSKCTLLQQCRFCFGENSGRSLWTTIKDVLNKLPLVAVIDDKIFASHSGIPLLKKDEKCQFVPDSGTVDSTSAAFLQSFHYQSVSSCNCQDGPIKKGPCRFVPSETMFEDFLKCKCSRCYFEFEEVDYSHVDPSYVSERRQLVRELLGNEPGNFRSSTDKLKSNLEESTTKLMSESSTFYYDIDAEVDGFCCSIRSEDLDGSLRQFNDVALIYFLRRFKFSHLLRARGNGYIDDISHGGRIISLTSSGDDPSGCRIQAGKITLYSLKDSPSFSGDYIDIGTY
ncbi:unnamed protein product [Phytomonas sp. Hart1]|nr:unnamed protein product [Phytomonas sp. Hart1]|eukprot:CCW66088.1 unnamed protein product [Phytomonas sp. isolate Hart1]